MINVTLQGIDYQIKQTPNEFKINEFEIISSILNDSSLDKIDKYSQLFIQLGIPQEVIDNLEINEFFNLIKSFTQIEESESKLPEKVKTIEINGRTYQAYTDEFKMNVKQMKLIENAINKNPNAYIGHLMAILFLDTQLTNNEHYVDAHIKHKAKLFGENVTADLALPYVLYFGKDLMSNYSTYATL